MLSLSFFYKDRYSFPVVDHQGSSSVEGVAVAIDLGNGQSGIPGICLVICCVDDRSCFFEIYISTCVGYLAAGKQADHCEQEGEQLFHSLLIYITQN